MAVSGEVGDVVADDYLCFVLCRCVHYSLYLCLVELIFLVCVKTMRRGALLSFSCYCLYLTGTHYFGFFHVFRHMFFDIRTSIHKYISVFYSYIMGVS